VFIDRETQESLVYVSYKHAPMRITTAAEYLTYLEVGRQDPYMVCVTL
jgi:hypothetical protein